MASNGPIIEVPPILQAMLNKVDRYGPMVLETGICQHCKAAWWSFHTFEESVSCGNCGKHNASRVPRYLNAMEALADSPDGTPL